MASGLSRVTIVAPRGRVDLALPSDVPLADLLPSMLGHAGGDLADDPAAANGWILSRLGSAALDSSRTPAQLDVRDGELLYLRPRGDEGPSAVFDDVVDAIATGTKTRSGRWTTATTRMFGLSVGVLALFAGAIAIPFAGPPHQVGAFVGLGLALTLLVAAVVFSRALGDARTATAFAAVASVYAAVGGLLALAGDRGVGQLTGADVVVAATAVLVVAVVASVGVAAAAPLFLMVGIGAVTALLTAGATVVFGVGARPAVAIAVVVAYASLPALPMLAYRLVGLPVPSVPTQRDHLRQDVDVVDGNRVLDLSRRADQFLAAMLAALASIGACAAVMVAPAGVAGLTLCLVLGLLSLVRARWFLSKAQRLPLLIAGAAALAAGAVSAFVAAGHDARLMGVLVMTIAVAVISIAFGLGSGRRRASPVWGRALDLFDVVLILAVVPLAIWVSGLYSWVRAIRG